MEGAKATRGLYIRRSYLNAIANLEYKPSHCRDVTSKIERSSMVLGPPTFQPAECYVVSSPALA